MSSLGVVRDLGDQQVYYVDGKTFARRGKKEGRGKAARQDGRGPDMNGSVGGEQAQGAREPYATYTPHPRDATTDLGQVNLVFVEGKTEGNVAKQEESTDWEPGKEAPPEGKRENSGTASKRRKRRDRHTRCVALANTTTLQRVLMALAVVGAGLFIAGVVESILQATSHVGMILLAVSSAFLLPPCLYLAYIMRPDCCNKYCRCRCC
ncbi:PREDICTED: uncharacterized protein LOC109485639 [Branchiostoma belcheri]|uniref:Uncharacterized protein LOC109485639 n=1 Tax=Branchiostoma belcheri TaxID=7741 RepID=A0A6P5AP74_BRABE|nr:PREDICTED: uncharacterized protein LOC109485639 [Branchiostoma belcheri]